ncbi:MAG TPA: transposase [Fimbriimonadaceae bacterium]|nr:transposase [Fimbriimonadaceae bacterium]HRJ33984.1 transposase [Fimbriimonadaceae bacterium]
MRRKRFPEVKIMSILKEIKASASMTTVGRAHGISDQTISRWREKDAGKSRSELGELKALQRLK